MAKKEKSKNKHKKKKSKNEDIYVDQNNINTEFILGMLDFLQIII